MKNCSNYIVLIKLIRKVLDENIQRKMKETFECIQESEKMPAEKKGFVLGIMKALGQAKMGFSQSTQDFMLDTLDSIAEDSLKKPKNRVALIMGIVGNCLTCNLENNKKWNEEKSKRYRYLSQAHIKHQQKHYKCPNMLISCFKLLCNDFIGQMKKESKFLLSFSKAKPDLDMLSQTLRDIIQHYPAIKLPHIKCIIAVYISTLLQLFEIIPQSISSIYFFSSKFC